MVFLLKDDLGMSGLLIEVNFVESICKGLGILSGISADELALQSTFHDVKTIPRPLESKDSPEMIPELKDKAESWKMSMR